MVYSKMVPIISLMDQGLCGLNPSSAITDVYFCEITRLFFMENISRGKMDCCLDTMMFLLLVNVVRALE